MSKGKKIPRREALFLADAFFDNIVSSQYKEVHLCGSIRRQKEMVGDLDIVIVVQNELDRFGLEYDLGRLFGYTKKRSAKRFGIYQGIAAQVMDVMPEEAGAAVIASTGSGDFNVHLRRIAQTKGWLLSQYGIFWTKSRKRVVATTTEQSVFDAFGIDFIPPEKRDTPDLLPAVDWKKYKLMVGT